MLEQLGAHVKYVTTEDAAHDFPEDMPAQAIQYVYEGLPNSGVVAGDAPAERSEYNDLDIAKGMFTAVDQTEILNEALEEFVLMGGDPNVDHQISQWGYLYYPTVCVQDDKRCKFTIVSHGANGSASKFADMFAPYAYNNDLIMYFPQGSEWDNMGYSGEKFLTN